MSSISPRLVSRSPLEPQTHARNTRRRGLRGEIAGRALATSALITTAVLIATAALVPSSIEAQQREIRFERIEEGLSQGTINALYQDGRGFMWLGTQDGLHRFDGYHMAVYKYRPGDPTTLPSSHIWAIQEDPAGDLWIGTERGPARWNRKSDRFERLSAADGSTLGTVIRDLWKYDDELWLADLGQGLTRLTISTGEVLRFRHDSSDPQSLASDEVLTLHPDLRGRRLWIGTAAGLNLLDLNSAEISRIDLGNLDEEGSGRIRSITEDHHGNLWLATYLGLVRYSPADRGVQRFRTEADALSSLASNIVRAVLADRDGRLWVGTEQGLDLLDPETADPGRSMLHYRADPSDPARLANPRIYSLFQDRSGVLWVGTQNGLHKWHPRSWAFGHLRHDPKNPDSLANNAVSSFSQDPEGDLWIGTIGGGLDRLDRETGVFHHFRPADDRGLDDPRIMALLHDAQGVLWVGTYRSGLHRFDAESRRFSSYSHRSDDPSSLSSNAVSVLFEDRSRTLWVGTFGGGLNRFDRRTGRVDRIRHSADDKHTLSSDNVTALAETDDGLWVATTVGLNLLDRQLGRVVRFPVSRQTGDPLTLMSLHVDPEGTLWLGTQGAGLGRLTHLDKERGEASFSFLTESDGLPNSVVYGIHTSRNGHLWVSTNNGLSRFDPHAAADSPNRFVNYDESHGLQQNEFNYGAHFSSADGKMFFGGFNGFNAFDPARLEVNSYPPPVVLTSVKKLNEPVRFDRPVEELDRLDLDHRDSMISFEFSALDFAAPDRNRYAYLLEGFDRDWIHLGEARRVTYTNLNPGTYTLRVKAANNDGTWNEAGFELPIHKKPAPWQTWWAYTLYVLLIGGTVMMTVRMRMNEMKARERELETMVAQRTAELRSAVSRLEVSKNEAQDARREAEKANQAKSIFLSSMSHELRTPLNSVIGFAGLLGRDQTLAQQHRKHLSIISQSGEHLLGLINDVLSLSKIEAGQVTLDARPFELERAVTGVEGMIKVRAQEQGVALIIGPFEGFPEVVHGDEKKLRQIWLNLLSNAVKFTPAFGEVRLSGRWTASTAFFNVVDTGVGIAEAEQEKLFEPFVQTESGRRSQEGTGLGLAITRDFARLMNGDIRVQSEPGKGTTVHLEVELPAARASDLEPGSDHRRVTALADGQGFRVVVADDRRESRLLLRELLSGVGFEVRTAVDGEQTLALWRDWRPDVIWTDLRMPKISGQEVVRTIRDAEAEDPDLPRTVILVLSATVLGKPRKTVLDLGADAFVAKPFSEHDIFSAMERHLGARFESVDPRPDPLDDAPLDPLVGDQIPDAVRENLVSALMIGDVGEASRILSEEDSLPVETKRQIQSKLDAYEIEALLDALEHDHARTR